jgi:signal transduction histidine kinase/DNA-binding response OmpR family regulator/HPt (histidine-containing phosphotransfer) domain-containing protein
MNAKESEQLEIRLGREFALLLFGILLSFAVTLAIVVAWGGKNNLKQNLIAEQKNIGRLFQQELEEQLHGLVNSQNQFSSLPGTSQKMLILAKAAFFVYRPEQAGERLDDHEATPLFENQVWFLDNALALAKQNNLDYLGLYLLSPHDSVPDVPPTMAVAINHGKLALSWFENKGKFRELEQYSYQLGEDKVQDFRVLRNISRLATDPTIVRESRNSNRAHLDLGLVRDKNIVPPQLKPKKSGPELLMSDNAITLRVSHPIFSDTWNLKSGRIDTAQVAILVYEKELNTRILKEMASTLGQELALVHNNVIVSASLPELQGSRLPPGQSISLKGHDFFAWSAPLRLDGVSETVTMTVLAGTDRLDALAMTIYRYIAVATLAMLIVVAPFMTVVLRGYTEKVRQRTMLLRHQNEKLDKLSLEAEAARQRLVDMTDRLPLTVVQFREDPNGERDFVFVGKNVDKVMGISTEELLADKEARWRNVLDEDNVPTKNFVMEQLAKRRPVEFDHRIRVDGQIRWIYTHLIPTRMPDGSWTWNGFYMDVTDAREQARELRIAKEQAEQATLAKSAFLANMSHEIRTPMNAIMGMSRLAMRTGLNPQQRDYLSKILDASESLLHIINDILDFSKVEAGQMMMEKIAFPLHEMLNQVAATVALKAHGKGLELLFEITPDVPNMLVGDPLRIGQVIINLANNAVKFTERGEIVVRVDCETRVDQKILLYITVADTGVGISPQQLATLFRPFTQADASTTRKFGGTGLGLVICKQMAELMHGQIWCNSEPGLGSVFTFTAELDICAETGAGTAAQAAAESATPAPRQPHPQHGAPLQHKKVLLVDDNHKARTILSQMLRQLGARAEVVASGQQALSHLAANHYDILLIDANMPGMSGLDTLQNLRQKAVALPKQVLLLSNTDTWADLLTPAASLGVMQVLNKPLLASNLLTALLPQTAIPQQSACASVPDYARLKGAQVLLVEDSLLNQQVALEFLQDVGIAVDTAQNGREGVESIRAKDYDLVLMDIQMPEMDGITATRLVRSDDRFADLRIIAMTAHAMSGDRDKSLAAGMNDHITKPIDPDHLYATLLRWLPARKREAAPTPAPAPAATPAPAPATPVASAAAPATAATAAAPAAAPLATTPALPAGLQLLAHSGIDVTNGLARHLHRVAFYERVLQMFVKEYGNVAQQLAALQNKDDAQATKRLFHNVKSASGTIGATALSALASHLELSKDPLTPASVAPFLLELERIFTLLASIAPQPSTPETPQPNSPDNTLAPLLLQLDPLLRNNDADALDLIELICQQHLAGPHGGVLAGINELIGHFSYDEAHAQVMQLLRVLQS